MSKCNCGSNKESREIKDGYGIYLCRVCEECEKEKISKFRPDIMEQYDCNEKIEPEISLREENIRKATEEIMQSSKLFEVIKIDKCCICGIEHPKEYLDKYSRCPTCLEKRSKKCQE